MEWKRSEWSEGMGQKRREEKSKTNKLNQWKQHHWVFGEAATTLITIASGEHDATHTDPNEHDNGERGRRHGVDKLCLDVAETEALDGNVAIARRAGERHRFDELTDVTQC